MTNTALSDLRRRRAQALIPTVRKVDGGYRVASSAHDTTYLVTKPNGRIVCTCLDFQHHTEEYGFQCKHILAVQSAFKQGVISHNGDHPVSAPATATATAPALPDSLHIVHRYLANEDPVRVKLIKNTKGYSWEIAVAEPDPDTALATLRDLEQKVKAEFGDTPDDP